MFTQFYAYNIDRDQRLLFFFSVDFLIIKLMGGTVENTPFYLLDQTIGQKILPPAVLHFLPLKLLFLFYVFGVYYI